MVQKYPLKVKKIQGKLQEKHPFEHFADKVGSIKSFFVLKIFEFVPRTALLPKFMTSQHGQQIITIKIMPISHELKATRQTNWVN